MRLFLGRVLSKRRFARQLIVLIGGSAAGQALIVLVTPMLSRIYSPEEFGWFATFTGILGFIGMASCWRFDGAIPLCRSDEDAAGAVLLALLAASITTALVAIGVWWARPWLSSRLELPLNGTQIAWFVPGIMLVSASLAFEGWAIQRGDVRSMVASKFGQGLGVAASQLVFGLVGWTSNGLIAGYVAGFLVGTCAILWRLPSESLWALGRVGQRRVFALARSHWRFAALSTPATLLNATCRLLPPVLVALSFGTVMAGLYGLAQRVVGLPIRFVGLAAGQLYTSEINRLGPDQARKLLRLHRRTTLHFTIFGLLFLAAVSAAGPPLFAVIFGDAWSQSGEIVRWLAPMYLLTFVRIPMRHVIYLFDRHDLHLWPDVAAAVLMAAAFLAGAWGWLSAAETIVVYSVGSALTNLIYLILLDWLLASRAVQTSSSAESTKPP